MTDPDFEIEAFNAGRGFDDAQAWLGQRLAARSALYPSVDCGWHDATVDSNEGSFVVVRPDGPQADLVGKIVRATYNDRQVLAYVVGSVSSLEHDVSFAQSLWMRLEAPAVSAIECSMEAL